MLFGMQETMIYKDVMIKGRRCPEIGCTETYAHCYSGTAVLTCTDNTLENRGEYILQIIGISDGEAISKTIPVRAR